MKNTRNSKYNICITCAISFQYGVGIYQGIDNNDLISKVPQTDFGYSIRHINYYGTVYKRETFPTVGDFIEWCKEQAVKRKDKLQENEQLSFIDLI